MRLSWVVVVAACVIVQLCGAQQAFLQDQLPLKVLVSTPSELLTPSTGSAAVTLSGRQALTVVFSRPVIALGSDWGSKELPDDLVPFKLSCGTPGRLRWVTTNIARFDPSVDWPTDLDCSLNWNKALKTYDGASLQLAGLQPSVRLQTQPLSMNVQQVQSDAAMAATGGQWSAFLGLPDDRLPEVPPDANVTLSFSYPVDLASLAKALRLTGSGAGGRALTVSPCRTAAVTPWPAPIVFNANGMQRNAGSNSADMLKLNSTCAVIRIVPGLEAGSAAVLQLPKGARYSPLAGPVTTDLNVNVSGLRPFRIPLRWDFTNISRITDDLYDSVTYRRLTLWLPHGLSAVTSLSDVKSAIQLCCLTNPFADLSDSRNCISTAFDLSRPYPAVLSLRVPSLKPRQRCVLSIQANNAVKDAFNLPLKASRNVWWTQDLDPVFTGPAVRQVALLEPAAGSPTLNWPWVARGAPETGLKQLTAVAVPVEAASSSSNNTGGSTLLQRAITSVLSGFGSPPASLMSLPGVKVARKDGTWPTFQSLALPGKPGISLIGSCCRQMSWPSPHDVLGSSVMVMQSDLQAAFIEQQGQVITWVTTTQGQSRPVAGAKVQIYGSVYNKDAATPGPTCTTSREGSCTIDLVAAKAAQPGSSNKSSFQPLQESSSYSAVITADGHGPLVVPDVPNSGRYRTSGAAAKEYVATLVLDRSLVKPGDSLHVTGFIQRKEGTQLKVAQDLQTVVLQVSPGFERGAAGGGRSTPTRVTAQVDRKYGTIHAVIPVPKTAPPATYTLQLWTPAAAGSGANAPGAVAGSGPAITAVNSVAPVSSLPRPASVAPVNTAAVPNTAQPATAGNSGQEAGPVRPVRAGPVAAVNPKPKQLMGSVLSFPASTPPGTPRAVPDGLREPNMAAAVAAAVERDGSSSGTAGQRRLQQADGAAEDAGGDAADQPGDAPVEADESVVMEPEPVESMPTDQQSMPAFNPAAPGAATNAAPAPLGVNIAYTSFTVGDPRPPTASLALTAGSNWLKPDGSVGVTVATKSYVGSDVSGAEVTLSWSTPKAQGQLVLKTNASGVAVGTVDLSKLPAANRSEPGESLALKATWVGPTREPLMQSKSIRIADGPLRVELQRTLLTDVPGVAFGVRADAFSNEDGTPVTGATVEVTLSPFNGTASLANCTASQRTSLASQRCSIKSGDATAAVSCQLTLPCAGDFVLKGCVTSGSSSNSNTGGANRGTSGSGCSKQIRLGRNMTTWVASPWSSGPGQIQLLPDRKNVSLGDDVAITLQNPYWGPVSALVVWGNGVNREQFFLDTIPPGVSTVVIQELGPECQGGCNVLVTLAVARPPPAAASRPTAPSSNVSSSGANSKPGPPGGSSGANSKPAPPGGSEGAAPVPRGLISSRPGDSAPPTAAPRAAGSFWLWQQPTTAHSRPQPPGSAPGAGRSFNTLWPFSIRVSAPLDTPRGSWTGLFGGRSHSSGRMLRSRVTTARSERGNAAPTRGIAPLPDIPRSKLYDPYAPATVSAEMELQVQDSSDQLQVNVTVQGQSKDRTGLAVLAPQSKQGSIMVAVRDAAGAPVPDAEVTLVVVDRAVLDLVPYALQDVSAAMRPKLQAGFSMLHLNSMRLTRAALNATFSTLQRRLTAVDPWLPVDTQVTASDGFGPADASAGLTWLPPAAAVDVPDDVYLRSYSTALTPLPNRPCPLGQVNCPRPLIGHSHGGINEMMVSADAAPMAAPAPAAAGAAGAMPRVAMAKAMPTAAPADSNASTRGASPSAAASGAQLRLQQAFKVTPLFKVVQTGPDGRASVDVPAPDNLGRFVVRAYAAAPRTAVKAAAPAGTSGSSSGAVLYGGGESELLVRRTVSLVPSLPRQVRVGDNFTAGVLVEAPGAITDVTVRVTATLQTTAVSGGSSNNKGIRNSQVMRLAGDQSRSVTLSPGKPQQEVRFNFAADSIGVQNITFAAVVPEAGAAASRAAGAGRGLLQWLNKRRQSGPAAPAGAAGAVADQVQLQVPVNGRQGSVFVATSFAVKGSADGGSWQEGMALPRAELGSGSVDLVAGVGSLPAVKAAYSGLSEQGLGASGCKAATQALALSILPAYLSLYQGQGTTAAAALSPQQLQLTQAAAAAATGPLTDSVYGLLPMELSCYAVQQRPLRADVALNSWAAWLSGQVLGSRGGLNAAGKALNPAALVSAWGSIQDAAKGWRKALEKQLVADAMSARQGSSFAAPAAYSDLDTLSWARLALGPGWSPVLPASGTGNNRPVRPDVLKQDLSMQRLVAAALAGNLTVGGQARVGLVLLQDRKASAGSVAGKQLTAGDAASRIAQRLVGNIRVGGRTAYIATGDGMRAAAGMSDQSLALSFLVNSSSDNPLVEKLAAWVAQGAAPPPLFFAAVCVGTSPWDATLRAQALTTYDSSTDSLTPDLKLTVNAQPRPSLTSKLAPATLLTADFTPQKAGQLSSRSTSWAAVPTNSTLLFSAKGTGQVSVAAGLNFTPANLLPFPTYRGLWVQRAVLLQEQGGGESSASSVQGSVGLGKIVTVAVQVTSPDDQADVMVEVMMPGGLEPLDPNVFRDPDVATICSSGKDEAPLTSGSGGIMGVAVKRGSAVSMMPLAASNSFESGWGGPGGLWRPIWPMCPVQTTSPDKVVFRFGYLRAGTHSMRFKAVAATSGAFVLPPVKAYVQQQPEVMGLSAAGALTVCPTASGGCAAAGPVPALSTAAPAKACPQDCNGNGACDLSRGACICDSGFAGVACGDLATY